MKVQEQACSNSAKFEVRQKLRVVNGKQRIDRLQFDDHAFFHQNVYPVIGLNVNTLVYDRTVNLTCERDSALS